MDVEIRGYRGEDVGAMRGIWNKVVGEGKAFPQEEPLGAEESPGFFGGQTYCGVAEDRAAGEVLGLYILHPNNVGRCGHIANASFAVASRARGNRIGEKLVEDCLQKGREAGFRILQFNAVVKTNAGARRLYEKLGFVPLGTIPQGFRRDDGGYEDIVLYYHTL